MAKISLKDTKSGYDLSSINSNFQKIEQELQNNVLYRSNPTGEPNHVEDDIDFNGSRILNLGAPLSDLDPLRKGDIVKDASGATVQFVEDYVSQYVGDITESPKNIRSYTTQEAKALTDSVVGQVVYLTDRKAPFVFVSQQAANEMDLIDAPSSGLTLQLVVRQGVVHLDSLGAVGDATGVIGVGTDDTKAIQRALEIGTRVVSDNSKHYRFTHTVFYKTGTIFDGGFAQFFFDCVGEGTAFMPVTYQEANNTNWTEDCLFKYMVVSTRNDRGNFFATAKGRRITFEYIYSDFVYFHVVDAAGGKQISIKNCISLDTRSSAYQVDVLNDSSAVWAVDEDGVKLDTAFSSGGEFWTYATDFEVKSCYVLGDGVTGTQRGVDVHRSLITNVRVHDCTFVSLNGFGVNVEDGDNISAVAVYNNTFINCNRDFDCRGEVDDLQFTGNISRTTLTPYYSVYIVPSTTVGIRDKVKVSDNVFTKRRTAIRIENYDNADVDGNRFERTADSFKTTTVKPSDATGWCILLDNCINMSVSNNKFRDSEVPACIVIKRTNATLCESLNVTGNVASRSGQFFTGEYCENANIAANSVSGSTSAGTTQVYLENGRGNGVNANQIKQPVSTSDSVVMHNEENFSVGGGGLFANSSQGNAVLATGNSIGKVSQININGLGSGSGFYVYAADTSNVSVFADYPAGKLKKDVGAVLTYSDITVVTLP